MLLFFVALCGLDKMTNKDFRIRFETKDGDLIRNRKVQDSSICLYIDRGRVDKEFTKYSLDIEAREKGVRIVEYTVDETGIFALVDYL